MTNEHTDYIAPESVKTLHGLFLERLRRSPSAVAYRYFDDAGEKWTDLTWAEMAREVARWAYALDKEKLAPGSRVGVMMRNCPQWVAYDQAALSLGLVVVPFYTNDRPDNVLHIIKDADVQLLLFENSEQWQTLHSVLAQLPSTFRMVAVHRLATPHPQVRQLDDWLPHHGDIPATTEPANVSGDDLAAIVYTSGTTGRPKGVMLSHANTLWNSYSGIQCITVYDDDLFLSFLPLSHTFERTVGYYIPIMTGATVAYARSIPQLAEDLQIIRPSVLISVPRIFERIYNALNTQLEEKSPIARWLFKKTVATGWKRFERTQGRRHWHPSELLWPLLKRLVAAKVHQKLGGQLRLAMVGGAPMSEPIAQTFLGLGVPLLQGYGLTEASPIISVNPLNDNVPASIGVTLPGIETRINEASELLTRSPCVMKGYCNSPEATADAIDADGWLHTGDLARQEGQHLFITGRVKEIIVLANGEKVPPVDIEMALTLDPLFEQALVIGEQRPFLSAILVLDRDRWATLVRAHHKDPDAPGILQEPGMLERVLERASHNLSAFPGYAMLKRVTLTLEPWTVENELLTAALKIRRGKIIEHFSSEIAAMYKGH